MTAWEICLQQLEAASKPDYVRTCPTNQAIALRLREEGYTIEEIARQMEIRPSGVEALLKRADRRIFVLEGVKAGRDPRELAKEVGITFQGITQIIKQHKESNHEQD